MLSTIMMILLFCGEMFSQSFKLVFGVYKIIISKEHAHIKHVEEAADRMPPSRVAPPFKFYNFLNGVRQENIDVV